MSRWISVTATDTNEDTLVNLDNVVAVQGRTIFFVGGDADDYLITKESHTELTALIARAERSKAYDVKRVSAVSIPDDQPGAYKG